MDSVLPETQINGKDRTTETADFKSVIEKSKQKIQAENQPIKRGRGRPPKIKVSGAPAPDTSSVNSPPSVARSVPAPDVTEYLIAPLMMLSKIPAHKTDIPEIALTPDEAKLCAMSCNHLIQIFIPDLGTMSPKTAAIVGACSVFGSIGFSKWQIYLSKSKEKTAKKEVKQDQAAPETVFPVTSAGEVFPVTNAGEHFLRRRQ